MTVLKCKTFTRKIKSSNLLSRGKQKRQLVWCCFTGRLFQNVPDQTRFKQCLQESGTRCCLEQYPPLSLHHLRSGCTENFQSFRHQEHWYFEFLCGGYFLFIIQPLKDPDTSKYVCEMESQQDLVKVGRLFYA